MKRKVLFIFAIFVLTCQFFACQSNPESGDNSTAADSTEVMADSVWRVAVMPTIDCLPLFVAEEEGLFDKAGVKVSLEEYDSQMDCDTALVKGRVDAIMSDLVRCACLHNEGIPLDYLTATNLHWQLICSKSSKMKSLRHMKDKLLGTTRYSALAMLTDRLADSVGLSKDLVLRIQVNSVKVRLQMIDTQVIDAMFLPEPQATAARKNGGRIVYDTQWDDVTMGVLAARCSTHSDSLRLLDKSRFLKAYDEACLLINTHGVKSFQHLINSRCGVDKLAFDSLSTIPLFQKSHEPRTVDVTMAADWLNNQNDNGTAPISD